jgi:hypothetical protein
MNTQSHFLELQIISFFIAQGVKSRKIFVQTSGVIFHANARKKIYTNMISQIFFEAQFPHCPEQNPLRFYFGDTQKPYSTQFQLKMWRPFNNKIFMPVQTFETAP